MTRMQTRRGKRGDFENLKEEPQSLYFSEMERATLRFRTYPPRGGMMAVKALQWCLDFSREEIKQLSEGQWSDLKHMVNCFARGCHTEGRGAFYSSLWPVEMSQPAEHAAWGLPRAVGSQELQRLPSRDAVEELQKQVRKDLDEYLAGRTVSLPLPPGSRESIIRTSDPEPKPTRPFIVSDMLTCFRHYLFTVLGERGPWIRRCQGQGERCKGLFIADRLTQEFCTAQCRSRTYKRKERGTPPERFEKRGRPKLADVTANKKPKGHPHAK